MPRKILVIDKSPELLDVIKFLLEQEGFDVETSGNSKILAEIGRIMPNLILVDEDLYKGIITEICHSLKTHGEESKISIIISSHDPNIAEITRIAEADGYIKKPFEINELVDVIKNTMQINSNFEK